MKIPDYDYYPNVKTRNGWIIIDFNFKDYERSQVGRKIAYMYPELNPKPLFEEPYITFNYSPQSDIAYNFHFHY